MKNHLLIVTLAVLGIAGSAVAQITPQPLPTDYQLLNRKSIFSRDRVTFDPTGPHRPGRPYGGGSDRPRPARVYTPVFIGVLLEDSGDYVAYIQDPLSSRVLGLHNGETLPDSAGVVKTINLDSMSVATADKGSRKITIGQNILGGDPEYPAPAAPPSAPAATAPAGDASSNTVPPPDASGDNAAPTAPPSAGAPAAGGPNGRQPGETMLDYFKRRRAMQLGK